MSRSRRVLTLPGAAVALAVFATGAVAQELARIAGAACDTPPIVRCPEEGCVGEARALVTQGGPVVEAETGRAYFLDYPCDLRRGEEVTFVLSLHGGGSYGNWQRHYFPLVDNTGGHRLVVATPFSPARVWRAEEDDAYLQNIVEFVIDEIGADNIRAFWLAGHSQGGLTSRRLVCTDFFRDKVDGFLSLSGGRVGGQAAVALNPPPAAGAAARGGGARGAAAGAAPGAGRGRGGLPSVPEPECAFSHIYETGEHELAQGLASLPETSTLAERYGCGPRVRLDDVVDTRGGYVFDGTRQENATRSWGRMPGPGRAQVYAYPDCGEGRVVADVVRIDKGHTEGLEPNVTESLVRMMVSARGGKLRGR